MTITVGLLRKWKLPEDISRQSPGHSGRWGDIRLVEPPETPCDYIVILNRPAEPTTVTCPPQNIWAIIDEPPNELSRHWHRGFDAYQRIFTQDFTLRGARYVLSHPALPWLVDRDYDYLMNSPMPDKEKQLSWVTSDRNDTAGHRLRMRFLSKLRNQVEFELYGRGFQPLQDKWEGLAPYRYSIAVENFHTPYYWSEKIADCFLAWTMPIYSGSSRIEHYFPKEAMVRIDIRDPQAIDQVREVMASDRWERNLDAIHEARQLVLNRYQLFPFLAQQITAHEACRGAAQPPVPQQVAIRSRTNPLNFALMLARRGLLHLVRDNPHWRTYRLE
jgi:Glycosyltransferase family 10 (fucosyltransferase) C-term